MSSFLDFSSDNWAGVSRPVMDAIMAANHGSSPAYGNDDVSRDMQGRFGKLFDCDLVVIAAPTGTAANGLALDAIAQRDGLIVAHEEAHIFTKEAGARDFFNDKARLLKLPGVNGKIAPDVLDRALRQSPAADRPHRERSVLSLTQATECGTVYSADEVATLAAIARSHDVNVHMDGARFANACATLNCAPADVTWKAGVDILTFGVTKNGALGTDAVVIFNAKTRGAAFAKRAHDAWDWFGYVASKGRFVAAQYNAMLADDHWLALARHANAMADRLAQGLERLPGVRLAFPRQINQVFAILPPPVDDAMRAAGARYHPWDSDAIAPELAPREDERLARLVCSFATTPDSVDRLIAAGASINARAAE